MAVWSGDRVRRDGAGLLHFVGRRDAMIKTSGHRVSPQEVEEAALATGLVAEAVALGLPDPRWARRSIWSAARPGRRATRRRCARPWRDLPAHAAARDALAAVMPLSPNGKHDRAGLARPWRKRKDVS
jgi:acyl-coenzyme A synthetase/AMP-(fatty) acid ligase